MNQELRAMSNTSAVCGNMATVQTHDLAYKRQSQAQSAGMTGIGAVSLPEAIKHMGQELGRDALTGILNAQLGEFPTVAQRELDVSPGAGELQCVG
jgi:hypothetical protein